MEREPRESKSFTVDLTKPLNKDDIMEKAKGCFGYLWDLRTSECSKCADRDVCGILFNDNVIKPTTDELEEKSGSRYLDLTDFKNVTPEKIFSFVQSGETPVQDLVSHVGALAQTSDRMAIIEFIKRFITQTSGISTKGGIVWLS